MPTELEAAIRQIRSGDREGGQHLLAEILARDPGDETAWLWLAGAVDDDERRRYCLSRVLQLNPGHALAREALARLALSPEPLPAPTAAAPAAALTPTGPEMPDPETAGPATSSTERSGAAARRRSLLLFLGTLLLLGGGGLAFAGVASLAGFVRDPTAYAAVAPDALPRFAVLVAGLACLVGGAWSLWRAIEPADEEAQD